MADRPRLAGDPMHCIHTQSGALVAEVVPPLIEEGYSFVRIDQVPEHKQYETPDSAPAVASAVAPPRRTTLAFASEPKSEYSF